jgi:hypothetical protein
MKEFAGTYEKFLIIQGKIDSSEKGAALDFHLAKMSQGKT